MSKKDVVVLRDLAKKIAEISQKDIQEEKRNLWRKHNSLLKTRPLVIVNGGTAFAREIFPESSLKCEDPLFRSYEFNLRRIIFTDIIGDDHIVEPWILVKASYLCSDWGTKVKHIDAAGKGGAYKFDAVIKEPEDISKLVKPRHLIDEVKTAEHFARINDAIGDIIEVELDRSPFFQRFEGDISYALTQLVGLEELMMYMYDRPEWLHEILEFMRDGILSVHEEADIAGDWNLCGQHNQAEPYSEEYADPRAAAGGTWRNELWGFFASQEFTLVSPEMFDEFLLQYQIPVMEKFGLIAYGCCEDLTRKIGYLKKIPNLRRIAVAPWADIGKCAEQIQKDYIFSWRPNPALMVCGDWDPDRIRAVVKEALEATKGCHIDITLKDIQTVKNEPERIKNWVEIVRDTSDAY